ncbi:MAG: hypothetical protein FWC39_13505 [Bacteroidetes bacterium]|nr:hypothetical protein [Bacteroidota bacterium]
MKRNILIFCIVALFSAQSFSQTIPITTTYYSKTDNGGIGRDKRTFYHLSNGKMRVVDEHYGTTTMNSGTLELIKTGFTENGHYFESFSESYNDLVKNGNRMVLYKIYYDKKGGKILLITEFKTNGNNLQMTEFYTNDGIETFE